MGFVEILEKFGLPVAFLAVMIWMYRNDKKDHKEERKEWKEDMKSISNTQANLQKDTNTVLREITQAFSESHDKKKINEKNESENNTHYRACAM